MATETTAVEKKLKPFEELGFVVNGSRGEERYGDCPFCGKRNKFHVNTQTQQWSCKAGDCQKNGNLITFIELWYEGVAEENEENEPDFDTFSKERGLPVSALRSAGIVWDGRRWIIPIWNIHGRICNLRLFNPNPRTKVKIRGIGGVDVELYGIEQLADPKKKSWPVWVVEGEFDAIAMRCVLKRAKRRGIVVAVPGAGTFKAHWADALSGREILSAYDNDGAGRKGTEKAYKYTSSVMKSFLWVKWPDTFPEEFDLRDFWKHDGDLANLEDMLEVFTSESEDSVTASSTAVVELFPVLKDGQRPTLEETVEVYRSVLHMTPDMEDALRVIYAVVITTQIPGDPLWIHVCAPPGGSKTELLMSCSSVANTFTRSTITVHSLVSGWKSAGVDPSIIPKLFGGTFILKDWTEVLKLPVAQRHEIYSIFRGAYDGKVEKSFGNAVERIFHGYFNMLTGVTPELFAEPGASLGERFLTFHMQQGTGWDVSAVVRAAFETVGREAKMKEDLGAAAKAFLETRIESSDIPTVPEDYIVKLVNLAQLVAMLRANVTRDYQRERILYRPQHEVGTRLVKQLHKLMLGLGLQNSPPSVGEEEYRIAARVAVDSCVGWNLDALRVLASEGGLTIDEICERAKIPKQTLRDQLEELVLLGVLTKVVVERTKVGRPSVKYYVSRIVEQFWNGAGLSIDVSRNGRKPRIKLKTYTKKELQEVRNALNNTPRIRRRLKGVKVDSD